MKYLKMLVSTMAALAVLLWSNYAAFAASSATEATEATTQDVVVTAEEIAEAATNADGTINAAPNTGVDFPPMAALFIALGCLPVILLLGRKPARDSQGS
jgi:hypothetical protein